jgi:hypothetical protein
MAAPRGQKGIYKTCATPVLDLRLMSERREKRRNSALWVGLLLTVLGLLTNALYFVRFPAFIVPWLNRTLLAIGLLLLMLGLARAFRQPQVWGGRISGSLLTAIAIFIFALSVWAHVHGRELPRSAGAPQIGEPIPDFTLPDSAGRPLSLSLLFSDPTGKVQPKAVLLVFYRGYW